MGDEAHPVMHYPVVDVMPNLVKATSSVVVFLVRG